MIILAKEATEANSTCCQHYLRIGYGTIQNTGEAAYTQLTNVNPVCGR